MTTTIDAHQHFWDLSQGDTFDYAWLTSPDKSAIHRSYLPEDLLPQIRNAGIDRTIFVQTQHLLAENTWALKLAEANPFIAGVVGWVDLRSDFVVDQLAEFASHPKFVGVRHVVQDEPDANFMLLPEFVRGIAKLKAFGLSYDILIFPKQLPAAIELVKQFPEQPFVLDHIAKPPIKDGVVSPWDEQICELAKFENLTCKVSGMVTEANWTGWQPTDFRPYLDVVFEAYGEDRVMYGSDWPVCKLAGSYRQVYGLAEEYVSSFSAEAREKFFGGVASAFYGLKG